jgi:hypothetical protein
LAVLKWEILWDGAPVGFVIPSGEQARFSLDSKPGFLSYCSRDVGVCARYRIDPDRNWERDRSAKCDGAQTDEDALLGFIGEISGKPAVSRGHRQKPTVGRGGLTGAPTPASGITWATTLSVRSRDEIVRQYKQMRPPDLGGLEDWIRTSGTPDSETRSIRIACFAPTDPMVYYYVDRSGREPIEMAAYWDKERQEWVVASSLERSQGSQRFEETRRIIDSIPCATIRLK